MPAPVKKPTPIPVQLSEAEFTKFILKNTVSGPPMGSCVVVVMRSAVVESNR